MRARPREIFVDAAQSFAPRPRTMTHLEHALTLYRAGRFAEALPVFRLAVKDDPLDPRVWYHTAVTALELGDFAFAIPLLQAYTRLVRDDPKALLNLGHAQFAVGDYPASLLSYERAAAIRPESVKALVALGHLSRMLGRDADARGYYDRVLAAPTEKPGDLRDRALVRLALGDHARGWAEFESRLLRPPPNPFHSRWRAPDAQRWDGGDPAGRPVCLYNQRGNGDTILFARYLPRAAERAGAPVTLLVQPGLRRLLAPAAGVGRVVEHPEEVAAEARYADMWSLPHLLGADLLTEPRIPYLAAPTPAARDSTAGPLRVGLAWAGHRDTLHDHDRSVPSLALLAPVLAVPGVTWTSLQLGDRADEARGTALTPPPPLADFHDTAALLAALDLVITVDTAVANLAGALGLAAWVLPPTYPEPRWELAGERSRWYPTLRLFRRAHTGDWPGVAARVAAALAEEARRRTPAA